MKIVENRKYFFGIAIATIVLGLIFMAYNNFVKKAGILNFGIEFKGGTVLSVDVQKEFMKSDIEDIVYKITNDKNSQIQEVIGENKVIIKLSEEKQELKSEDIKEEETQNAETTQTVAEVNAADNQKVVEDAIANLGSDATKANLVFVALKIKYELTDENLIEMSHIAPTVGKEMTKNAITSVLLAAIVILVYVSFRFNDTKMGIASILALIHDVLVVLALYAIFRFPVGNSFIAAILTIVGYSINNTIVIFDRIRENNRGNARLHKNTLINRSISETMTRTINTSLTTLLSILALYFLGVDAIREFTLPIIAGILVGTFSSVTISGPLWFQLIQIKKKEA